MTARSIRLTEIYPWCQTAFTFKDEEKWKKWRESGGKEPLHQSCKSQKLRYSVYKGIPK